MRDADRRAVEVYVPRRDGGFGAASGYLLDDGLVLTCSHVLDAAEVDDKGEIVARVRLHGHREDWPARPVWCRHDAARSSQTGVDAALLRISDPAWRMPADLPALRWGRFVGSRPEAPVTATGFPSGMKTLDAARRLLFRDIAQISGTVNPGSRLKAGRLEITVGTPVPSSPDASGPVSRWKGMSGAGLLANGLLAGVVAVDTDGAPGSGTMLGAVPADTFVTDPGFRACVGEIRLEPVELRPLLQDQAVHPAGSPLGLLRPEVGVVPFHGRERELADLVSWCRDDGAFPVRLTTGAGGEGKTRLARELVERMREHGWCAGLLNERAPAADMSALGYLTTPALLVVDYAETRVDQVAALIAELDRVVLAAADQRGDPARTGRYPATDLRVLLLARSAGEWWDQLRVGSLLLRSVPPATVSRLGPLESDEAGRYAAFFDAADAIAARLPEVPGFEHTPVSTVRGLTRPRLGAGSLASALSLQAAALVAVLQSAAPVDAVGGDPDEQVLLLHEQRFWQDTAPRHRLERLHPETLRQIVATATLFPAADSRQAGQVLGLLAALRGQSADTLAACAAWIADVYPGADGYWRALQPDVVGDYLVGSVTAAHPDLVTDLLPGVDEFRAEHALHVLARASRRAPHLSTLLVETAPTWPFPIAAAAVAAATGSERPEPLLAALDALVREPAVDRELLEALLRRTPRSTVALSGWALELARRVTELRRRPESRHTAKGAADLAYSLDELAFRLARDGRAPDAVAPAEEAHRLLRDLSETMPEAHLPAFADVALTYAFRLGGVGRLTQAVELAEEATTVYTRLQAQESGDYRAPLARCLHHLAILLSRAGHATEAAARAGEALKLRRDLISAAPGGPSMELAATLTGYAVFLAQLGRAQDALEPAAEAVRIYRRLADAAPDAWLPDLAKALISRANCLRAAGFLAEAEQHTREAVDLYRALSARHPDAYRADFAVALNNQANHLADLGRPDDALTLAQEAVDLYRQLVQENPDAHRAGLAMGLNNLANHLADLGHPDKALLFAQEAVDLYRQLTLENPVAHQADLAMALNNQATLSAGSPVPNPAGE